MNDQNQKIVFSKLMPVMFGFYIMAFVDIVGPATEYVRADFDLSPTVATILATAVFFWFFVMSIPTGIIQGRIGRKNASAIGIALTGIGMFVPYFFYSHLYTVIIGFALIGIGNTMMQVALNPLLLFVTPPSKYGSFLNLSQSIKSLGDMASPLIVTFFAQHLFHNWKITFLVFGIASIISFIWLYFTKIEETSQKDFRPTFGSSFSLLFKNSFVFFMVLGIFLFVGLDVGMNARIPRLMIDKFDLVNMFGNDKELAKAFGTNVISLYYLGKMLGCLIGAILLTKVSIRKLFIATSFLTLIALLGMYLAPSLLTEKIMIFCVSFFSCNIFAIIFAITIQKIPGRTDELSGLMIMAVAGGAVIPPVMGVVSDALGYNGNILVLAICGLYLLGLAFVNLRNKANAIQA